MQEGTSVVNTAVAEQNPVEVSLYTSQDVARYLRVPVWLVVSMWQGRFPPHPEFLYPWFKGRFAQFDLDEGVPGDREMRERWSFRQLGELYVRMFAVESLME